MSVNTYRKHLDAAQRCYPDLVKLWGRKGAEWILSKQSQQGDRGDSADVCKTQDR